MNPTLQEPVSVLMVDDQPAKLLSYRAILEETGADLVSAQSATEALALLLKHEFAVIIVDVCMPDLDGFELAEMLRQHPRFEHTAIIFVSAVHMTDLDRLRGYAVGAVDYLPVPVVPEILRAKVQAFVELYRKARELEHLNRELERRVAERTMELEDAGKRKDEFLAVLAHELRNPLAAIRTAAELAGFPHLPAGQRAKAVDVIQRQVQQLVRLIDDLIDVSRITHGVITLKSERVDVSAVIAQALETCGPLIDERGHVVDVRLPDESLHVHGDPARLSQVVANIINNAAKFTERNGRIEIAVERAGGNVSIRISDNGLGVPAEIQGRLFELFVRGERPFERASTGLGIGLALVRRLVEMHSGQVSLESEGAGRGTTVRIALPLLTAEQPPVIVEPAVSADRMPNIRILVVDDNVDAAESLAMLLRLDGHDVLTADGGHEAVRLASTFQPQAVLLDLGMPGLNGYETAKLIRQTPWGRDIGLVAVTGWGQLADRDRTLEAGFSAHMVKPVDHREVIRVLTGVVPSPGSGVQGPSVRPRVRP